MERNRSREQLGERVLVCERTRTRSSLRDCPGGPRRPRRRLAVHARCVSQTAPRDRAARARDRPPSRVGWRSTRVSRSDREPRSDRRAECASARGSSANAMARRTGRLGETSDRTCADTPECAATARTSDPRASCRRLARRGPKRCTGLRCRPHRAERSTSRAHRRQRACDRSECRSLTAGGLLVRAPRVRDRARRRIAQAPNRAQALSR